MSDDEDNEIERVRLLMFKARRKKNTTPETERFQACNDFSPLHRFNRIKATDTQRGFRRLHRSSVFHWLHFHLTSNFFFITALASLPSKDPPFPRPKIWRHGPILQIEIAQVFSCYILLHWISNFIFTTCLPCVLFLEFSTCKAFLITWRNVSILGLLGWLFFSYLCL